MPSSMHWICLLCKVKSKFIILIVRTFLLLWPKSRLTPQRNCTIYMYSTENTENNLIGEPNLTYFRYFRHTPKIYRPDHTVYPVTSTFVCFPSRAPHRAKQRTWKVSRVFRRANFFPTSRERMNGTRTNHLRPPY